MVIYAFVVAVLVIVFGLIIHLVYKFALRRGKYNGLTLIEGLIIFIGTVPGLAGCAGAGGAGAGFPLPLIIGLPLHLIYIDNNSCGWGQLMLVDYPNVTTEFISFPIAWFIANLLVLGSLYYFKMRSSKKLNNK
jgi:hypothetical protein